MEVTLHDHLIDSENAYYSFSDERMLQSKRETDNK